MKSTTAALVAVLASAAAAQPHGYQHAHMHQEARRMDHAHDHMHHDKRHLVPAATATEVIVEWVTITVDILIDATTTVTVTDGIPTDLPVPTPVPTTFSTYLATTATPVASDPGQFFEGAFSLPPVVVEPVPSSPPVVEPSVYVAAVPDPVTTPVYIAPVVTPEPEPTPETPAYVAPIVVPEPKPTTLTTSSVAAAITVVASTPPIVASGTSFEGKITWIGPTDGAYGSCGNVYGPGKMYVAVNPGVLDCGPDGKGTLITITANGKTVTALAADKCMGCTTNHIDVDTYVYRALGYDPTDPTDGGMHNNPGLKWVLAST